MISFDPGETSCYAVDSLAAFARIYWIQIVPFALGAASVEQWFLQKRKEYAKNMLSFLHTAERNGWHYLVTGDESWFFFDTSPRRMWTLSRDDVATKSRQQIQSKSLYSRLYGIRLGYMLSIDFQMIPKWIATISWQIYLFPSYKWSFLEEGHGIKNDW
jgi:hypothetical protein